MEEDKIHYYYSEKLFFLEPYPILSVLSKSLTNGSAEDQLHALNNCHQLYIGFDGIRFAVPNDFTSESICLVDKIIEFPEEMLQ